MKFLILFFLSFVTSVYAEGDAARMSDGRAFRIDSEGVRVVDQLAELEVRNKELKNRIISLEDSLGGQNTNGLPKARTSNTDDCQSEVEGFKNQISKLESISQSSAEENQRLTEQIALLQSEKQKKIGSSNSLDRELSNLQIENNELKAKLNNQNKYARASLSSNALSNVSNISSNNSRNPRVKNVLNVIQAKIMKRKNILDKLDGSKRGISINASSLVTKSGLSLDRLRQATSNGSEGNDVYLKLKEIESILDDDISTASRLKR